MIRLMQKSLEDTILEIVKEKTKNEGGIVQSVLWGLLEIDNREGTKTVLKLVRMGLIKREPVVHKGRRTYKLIYVTRKINSVKVMINLNPVMDVPCFTCKTLERCSAGGYFNPFRCIKLSTYLCR